jgi:competence protein ComGC
MFIDGLAVHTLSNNRLELDTVSNKLVAVGPIVPMWFLVFSTATLATAPWLRWHFSLRTLLIATTLLALVLGLVVDETRKERHPINDVGQSAGFEMIGGQPHAFLLTSVPGPASLALFALGTVVLAARRVRIYAQLLCMACALSVTTAAQAAHYIVTDLGVTGAQNTLGWNINASGQVTGYAVTAEENTMTGFASVSRSVDRPQQCKIRT